jgi:hypothetical protein
MRAWRSPPSTIDKCLTLADQAKSVDPLLFCGRHESMERARDYLRRAENAEASARLISDPAMKRQMAEIANQWRALARQAAELAASGPGPGGDGVKAG